MSIDPAQQPQPQAGTAIWEGDALAQQPTASEKSPPASQSNVLARDLVATGELEKLRRSELIPIHRALARMCMLDKPKWRRRVDASKVWGAGAILFIGGSIGGFIGLWPFLAAHPNHVARREYIAGIAVAFVLGLFCSFARMTRDDAKVDSALAVYEMVDDIVTSYEAAIKEAATIIPESPQ